MGKKIRIHWEEINWKGVTSSIIVGASYGAYLTYKSGDLKLDDLLFHAFLGAVALLFGFGIQRTDRNGNAPWLPLPFSTDLPHADEEPTAVDLTKMLEKDAIKQIALTMLKYTGSTEPSTNANILPVVANAPDGATP